MASVQPALATRFAGVATTSPAGSVSTKSAVSVAATAFGFAREMPSFEVPPVPIVVGVNDLLALGGWFGLTNRFAVTVAPLLPALVCSAPAGIVFV